MWGGRCCWSQKCGQDEAAYCVGGPGSGAGATTQILRPGRLSLPLTGVPEDALEGWGWEVGLCCKGRRQEEGPWQPLSTEHSSVEALLCRGVRTSGDGGRPRRGTGFGGVGRGEGVPAEGVQMS